MSDKRPEKEVSLSKELAETKRENHKLRRQLAKAQRRLVKVLEAGTPAEPDETSPVALEITGNDCPECAAPLTVMQVGPKTLKACKKCKWRKVES